MNQDPTRKLGSVTGSLLVVATMIGTGVFTTTGFMIKDLQSLEAIIFSWLLGGVLALCGALSYAELAVLIPQNGGEYNLLSRLYNPMIGFLAGWVSFIVGFSAAVASSALAFGIYLNTIVPVNPMYAALCLVIVLSAVHSTDVKGGSYFQNIFTALKILLILVFIAGGLILGTKTGNISTVAFTDAVLSPGFAIGLVYVSYSYSGWNSAIYIAGEMKQPEKKLPLSLIGGTLIVTLLYLGLNYIYISRVPAAELSGVLEIGNVTARYIFGSAGAIFMSCIIAFGLISSVGSMIMSGPRIYQKMGEDYPKLSFLSKKNKHGAPFAAVIFQSSVSIVLLLTSGFDQLLKYIGFTLSLVAALSVAGLIVFRLREPDIILPYRTPGYPFTPLLFIVLSLWMIIFSVIEEPYVALTGLATIGLGLLIYFLVKENKN